MNLVFKTALLVMLVWQSVLQADFRSSRFYPDHAKIQFAGNQGLVSIGPSWQFFKKLVEIDLMYGYLPQKIAGADIHSLTIKRNVLFLTLHPLDHWEVKAIIDLSTIYSVTKNTYMIWPSRYPSGYYPPNAIHHQIGLGLRLDYSSQSNQFPRKISIYAEAGILDDHLRHHLRTGRGDIVEDVNLALGLRFNIKDDLIAKNTD